MYCLFKRSVALVIVLTEFSTPALITVESVPEECCKLWKYGPGSSGAVLINSAALLAAALTVRYAYV